MHSGRNDCRSTPVPSKQANICSIITSPYAPFRLFSSSSASRAICCSDRSWLEWLVFGGLFSHAEELKFPACGMWITSPSVFSTENVLEIGKPRFSNCFCRIRNTWKEFRDRNLKNRAVCEGDKERGHCNASLLPGYRSGVPVSDESCKFLLSESAFLAMSQKIVGNSVVCHCQRATILFDCLQSTKTKNNSIGVSIVHRLKFWEISTRIFPQREALHPHVGQNSDFSLGIARFR